MASKVLINQKGMQRVRAGHPWVFRSDVVSSDAAAGEVVQVEGPSHQFLGQAFFNPKSQITVRMLTRGREAVDREFLKGRMEESIQRRASRKDHDAMRLIFSESDLLPGLMVDRYGSVVVFQTLCLGMDLFRNDILAILNERLKPEAIVERNDPPVRDLEGLVRQTGVVQGELPSPLEVKEGSNLLLVDPIDGQKTGLFLDQAENHVRSSHYARGRTLDVFSYQGGFALPLARSAETVTAVDSSAGALNLLKQNLDRNNISNVTPVEANGFDYLRECQDRRERFDTIVLDPPPFVRDRKNLTGGVRGYKEINLRAMKTLNKDGILLTCSCSQNFTPKLFETTLLEAARDARRDIQILERRGAAPDHPVLLTFPESSYLQCWVLRVL